LCAITSWLQPNHACERWADGVAAPAAQVYKAIKDGVTPVAVKVFPSNATDVQQEEFQREVVILKSCRDRNIVQFLGACVEAGQTFLVTGARPSGLVAGWLKGGGRSAGPIAHDAHALDEQRSLTILCND